MAPTLYSFVQLSVPDSPYDSADWRTWFYLAAQLVGGAGLTLLLATMLWPTIKRKPRNPLLISMCFSWWFSSFPSVLLLYYAGQVTGPPPQHSVCLASAVLAMSQTVLSTLTALALIFHIWLVVQTAVGSTFANDHVVPLSTMVCLVLPWLTYSAVAFVILGLGLHKPQLVRRATFYCVIDDRHLSRALGLVGSVAMLAAIIFEVWTVVLLFQNRSCIKQLSRDGRRPDFPLILRVCMFGMYVFLGLGLNIVSVFNSTSAIPDLFYCTFPLAVFMIFGTQPDIWRIWRDASRQMASRRSTVGIVSQPACNGAGSNRNSHSATRFFLPFYSFPFFSTSSSQADSTRTPARPRRGSYPLQPAACRWSPTATHARPFNTSSLPASPAHASALTRSLPPTLPLPAALRASLRHHTTYMQSSSSSRRGGPAGASFLQIASTTDLHAQLASSTDNSPVRSAGVGRARASSRPRNRPRSDARPSFLQLQTFIDDDPRDYEGSGYEHHGRYSGRAHAPSLPELLHSAPTSPVSYESPVEMYARTPPPFDAIEPWGSAARTVKGLGAGTGDVYGVYGDFGGVGEIATQGEDEDGVWAHTPAMQDVRTWSELGILSTEEDEVQDGYGAGCGHRGSGESRVELLDGVLDFSADGTLQVHEPSGGRGAMSRSASDVGSYASTGGAGEVDESGMRVWRAL